MKNQQKIRFSGDGDSHPNGAEDHAIKTVLPMASTMLMHAALRFPEDIFFTDLWPMAMNYSVWVYNQITDIQYELSTIEIWSRSMFEPSHKDLATVMFGVVQHIF